MNTTRNHLKTLILTIAAALVMCFFGGEYGAFAKDYYVEDILTYVNNAADANQGASGDGCMGWINLAFENVYGWPKQGCCGYGYGAKIHKSSSLNDIPVGAIVYFQYTDAYPYGKVYDNWCGNYAGHVGIHVGGGVMVHTFDWANGKGTRVYRNNITDICSSTLYRYCGWGWYYNTELVSKKTETPKQATLQLELQGGEIDKSTAYTSWGAEKTTTTKPTESDVLQITKTAKEKQYKYFHYHNNYEGTAQMIDSIAYTGNWDYCEFTSKTPLTTSKSFQDKGGRTSVKVGQGCKYNYTLWFEDVKDVTVYTYKQRTKIANVTSTISISADGTIQYLPAATKSGKNFICWNTEADGSGKSYFPGENVKYGTVSPDCCYILYAIFANEDIGGAVEDFSGMIDDAIGGIGGSGSEAGGSGSGNQGSGTGTSGGSSGGGSSSGGGRGDAVKAPAKSSIKKATSTASQKLTVKFAKVSGCDGYQVVVSTRSDFYGATTKSKNVGAGKTSVTFTGLKSGKTYYVRIRTYKNSDYGKVYSDFSSVKNVKVK